MAKYFLGSVGKAEAFRINDNGDRELAFVSKTLTDSGLNISTTKDDIRAGQGAPVQFSFCHDSTVEVTLTDVLWKPEYLEAQLGARFDTCLEDYVTDKVHFANGVNNYDADVLPIPFPCADEKDPYIVWGAPIGSDDWKLLKYTPKQGSVSAKIEVMKNGAVDTSVNGDYCIRYLGHVSNARAAEINSMFIPQELFLVITAPIFAGDACAASKGKAAGHITFEIPRFLLNGAQDFAMNMSSNQTMSLAGQAMASEAAECDAVGGKLLRIIEVIDNRDWQSDVEELILDDETKVVGAEPVVFGEMGDGHVMRISNNFLAYEPALKNGKTFEAKSYTITLLDKNGAPMEDPAPITATISA